MRIGIEAQRLFRPKKFGMDIVALELIKNLMLIDVDNEYVIFVKPDFDNDCLPSAPNFRVVEIKTKSYPLWEQISLPRAVRREKIDILHCTANTAPLCVSVPVVLTLHDIIFMETNSLFHHTGTLYQRFGNFYRRLLVPLIVGKCETLVTVSTFEKQRIDNTFNLPEKTEVIYNGAGCHFYAGKGGDEFVNLAGQLNLSDDYFLFIGNTDVKKNTLNVLKAYASYFNDKPQAEKLVIVNLRESDLNNYISSFKVPSMKNNIILTGYLKPHDLALLLRNCKIFLVPSLRESFGIPILEGMLSGVPVITSNTSSMPEIAGDAAFLVDPNNPDEISQAIRVLSEDGELREKLIHAGLERAKQFSWGVMAKNYLDLYKRIFQSKI